MGHQKDMLGNPLFKSMMMPKIPEIQLNGKTFERYNDDPDDNVHPLNLTHKTFDSMQLDEHDFDELKK